MRKLVLALIVVAGLVLVSFAVFRTARSTSYRLHVKTYFRTANSLKAGALVRVDGVDVGSVTSVRVRPELGEHPVEVLISVSTPYPLNIPNDSTASLSTAGVLGETLVDIDTRKAQGLPVADGSALSSLEPTAAHLSDALGRVGEALIEASRGSKLRDKRPTDSGKSTTPER
jgi:phospholipid/cholesterol/gamma-HCH transport system substrate-binding protein